MWLKFVAAVRGTVGLQLLIILSLQYTSGYRAVLAQLVADSPPLKQVSLLPKPPSRPPSCCSSPWPCWTVQCCTLPLPSPRPTLRPPGLPPTPFPATMHVLSRCHGLCSCIQALGLVAITRFGTVKKNVKQKPVPAPPTEPLSQAFRRSCSFLQVSG